MVRIRLRRVGRKKQPSFRLVAAEKESPRDGRFIEVLGFYNPRTEPATIRLEEARIYEWLGNGAQLSEGAMRVCRSAGMLERYERYKAGEELEKLLQEAAVAEETRNVSGKTQRPAPAKKKKAEPVVEEPAAEAPAAAAPAAEAEAEEPAAEEAVEEPVAEEPAAEVEEEAAPEVEAAAEAEEEAAAEEPAAEAEEETEA